MDIYKFSNELRIARDLTVFKRKKRFYVKDGLISHRTTSWPPDCSCTTYVPGAGCRHVFALLLNLEWSESDMRALPKSTSGSPGQSSKLEECTFCLEPVCVSSAWLCSSCGNTMHNKCADRWLRAGKGCPVCRA